MRSWDSFDIIIRRKGAHFFAGVPEIGLYARGDDQNAALAALEKRKREIENELGADFEPFAIVAPTKAQQHSESWAIGRFALKLLLVICLVGGSSIYVARIVAAKIEQASTQLRTVTSTPQMGAVIRRQIEKSADAARSVSDAEKQKLADDVRAIAERWKPVINEIVSVLLTTSSCRANACEKSN